MALQAREPRRVPANMELLRTSEVARWLSVSPATLRQWRTRGVGPRYVKNGNDALGYLVKDIERWLRERTVATNGRDAPERKRARG